MADRSTRRSRTGGQATQLRGLLYGPLTFEWASVGPLLFGPSILATKLPAALLFAATVLVTGLAARRAGATVREATLAAAAMTVVLGISEAPYWARADSVLILAGAISACIVAAPPRRASFPPPFPWGRAVVLGLLAGAASAMKLHGAAYVAPACLLTAAETVRWRQSLGVAIAIGIAALIAFALPFLPGGVSVTGFLFYVGLAAHHGLSVLLLLGNLTLLTGISLPILVLACFPPAEALLRRPKVQSERRPGLWRLLAGTAFGCALGVAVIASKPGAGYPHLLPFVPYAALILSQVLMARGLCRPLLWTPTLRTLAVGVLFLLAFGIPVLVRAAVFGFRGAMFTEIRAGSRQVQEVIAAHPGETVAVGYGGNSFLDLRLSYLRVLPVFAGHPLLYDATAMDDLWQGGTSRAIALPALDRCDVRVWLIPGNEPFTIRDFYGGYTFPEAFRQLFRASYSLRPAPAGEDGPFQVWICKRHDAAPRAG